MTNSSLQIAELDANGLERLRALENELGSTIIAYRPESPFTPLDGEQLRRLQELERELGVVLLAYRQQSRSLGGA